MEISNTNYFRAGVLADIPRQGGKSVSINNTEIALIRTLDDRIFAVNNTCPHKKGPLSEGIVHGHKVTCPLHNWVFDLEDGQAQFPDEGSIGCYPGTQKGDEIFVQVEK